MRRLRWFAGLTLLLLVAAACGGGGRGQEQEGASITIAIGTEPSTLDPQIADDGGERAVNDNIYETLMARTPDGELVPGLAAEPPTQVDDTTWQFKLREGVTFQNGEPFNADSVAKSVTRIIDPDFASDQASFYATISGAEKVDDLTVNVTTTGPDPVLPARMYWMKMVPATYSDDPAFAQQPSGTGPYRFVEWVAGDHVTLEANPDYWGEAPSIARVTYRFVAEPGTRLSGLLAGEYDLITNLLPEDADRAPKFAHVQGLEHPVIILNADGGATADVRVRQALNYAVDKEALAQELFGGLAVVDDGQILSPSWFGYNPNLQAYPYDPDRARELLREAGAEGATIELVGESGRWLKDRETIEAVATFWNQVGINTNVSIFEFSEYLDRLFGEVRPDSIYVTSSNELLDADRNLSAYYDPDGVGASNNDRRLNELLDQARTETDPATRQALYEQATQLAYDQAYFVWLLNIEDTYGLSQRLEWQPRVDAKLLVKEMRVTG